MIWQCRKMDKDREKGLLDLVDLTERFMGDNFQKSSYEGTRKDDTGSGFRSG